MVPFPDFGLRELGCSSNRTGLVGMILLTGPPTQETDEGIYRRRELGERRL